MAAYAIEYVKENPGIMLYMLMLLIANISGLLYAQQKVLGLKRSQKVLMLYIIPKTLAVNLLMGVILLDYMPKDRNWMTIYMVTTALCGILTPLVMWYTYEGSLAKVINKDESGKYAIMSPVKVSDLAVAGEKPASTYRTHTVVKGDTLWDIAERYLGKGSRYSEIKTLSGLTSNVIYSGQKLKIPN